jgi:hypothetical protein
MAGDDKEMTMQEAQAILEAQRAQLIAQVQAEIAAICEKYQVALVPICTIYGQQIISEVRIVPR